MAAKKKAKKKAAKYKPAAKKRYRVAGKQVYAPFPAPKRPKPDTDDDDDGVSE